MFRFVKPHMSHSSQIMIYYSLYHSGMPSGIIFWGTHLIVRKSLNCKKIAIRIMIQSRNKDSCRNLFKKLGVLSFKSQYIFSILLFVVKNTYHFKTNYDSDNIPT